MLLPLRTTPSVAEQEGQLIETEATQSTEHHHTKSVSWQHHRCSEPISLSSARKLMDQVRKKVTIRCINRQRFAEEMQILREIFNSGWQQLGICAVYQHEFATMGDQLKYLVPDDDFISLRLICTLRVYCRLAEHQRARSPIPEVIALSLRLVKLRLWRLKVSGVPTARVPLMGVRDEYQFSRIGPVIALLLIEALRDPFARRKIDALEMSWILETNTGMNNMLERFTLANGTSVTDCMKSKI